MHIHIETPEREAKFWLEPLISLSESHHLKQPALRDIEQIVEEQQGKFRNEWRNYFSR